MNRLGHRIARDIAMSGPITVADYMARCLYDPQEGYYTTRVPIGAAGDFITAPEISQVFGELVGVWLYAAWLATGSPLSPVVAEIGPGRGTMMADILRTLARLDAGFPGQARIAMVETSPRLTGLQRETLRQAGGKVEWHTDLSGLPDGPLFLIGNEIFDAIPVRQFVRATEGWRERCVGLDEAGSLCFTLGSGGLDTSALPGAIADAPRGAILEVAPARSALMGEIAARIAAQGGAALFFDYGHLETAVGDTLQAMSRHRHVGILDAPGEADLTSHVDFAALSMAAIAEGCRVAMTTQGEFLLAMGISERMGRLAHGGSGALRADIEAAAMRLVAPEAMGTLFKACAVARPGTDLVAFPPPVD